VLTTVITCNSVEFYKNQDLKIKPFAALCKDVSAELSALPFSGE